MTDFEKEEFWKALGRLYDSTVELRQIAESHEKRLDQTVTIIQWLAEKERKREQEGL